MRNQIFVTSAVVLLLAGCTTPATQPTTPPMHTSPTSDPSGLHLDSWFDLNFTAARTPLRNDITGKNCVFFPPGIVIQNLTVTVSWQGPAAPRQMTLFVDSSADHFRRTGPSPLGMHLEALNQTSKGSTVVGLWLSDVGLAAQQPGRLQVAFDYSQADALDPHLGACGF
jgi:hypothetical protein